MKGKISGILTLFSVMAAAWAGSADPAAAARSCIHSWAVPGVYEVTGNFRGRPETTTIRLTSDCRVVLSLPGVFGGGPLSRSGSCVRFGFKVQGERATYSARWCGSYGIVPWQGREIRASVRLRSRAVEEVKPTYNFNQ